MGGLYLLLKKRDDIEVREYNPGKYELFAHSSRAKAAIDGANADEKNAFARLVKEAGDERKTPKEIC